MAEPAEVVRVLKQVTFPGIDRDIVSLGYLKDIRTEGEVSVIQLELSTNLPGAGEQIELAAKAALEAAGIPHRLDVAVRYTGQQAAPGGAPGGLPEFEDLLPQVRIKIAVASGKGGVGKSTVAVNLALALARLGHKTGLLDCDVYGPSVPLMMGMENDQPVIRDEKMVPLERYGVRSMSIGYLIDRDTPVIWRGPMVGKAIDQLLQDVDWDGIDVLVFDLPPGTGDTQISLSQKTSLTGAVIVTTPQDVALIDAGKAVLMFEKVDVPVLGIVENMSYFACPHCGERTEIFRRGGGKKEAERHQVQFLGEIPMDPEVALGGDLGTPILVRQPESPAALAFQELARRVLEAAAF